MLFGRPDKELDEDNEGIDSNNCTIGHCSETKFIGSNIDKTNLESQT